LSDTCRTVHQLLWTQSRHSNTLHNLSILSHLSVAKRMNTQQKIIAAKGWKISAKKWVDALESSGNGDAQKALTHLDYVDKYYKGKYIRYHLLRGFVCLTLKRNSEAVGNFGAAIELLKVVDSFNQHERNYVFGYATFFGNKALEEGNNINGSESFPQADITSINLSKVRESLKLSFPLRDHPNWNERIE
jgi:hypothetical protein